MKIGEGEGKTGLELRWLGHSGFLIKGARTMYIDPYNISSDFGKADIILITHSHYDHCSIADMQKIVKEGTVIIIPADAQSKITRFNVPIKIQVMGPNQEIALGNIRISTLPAYNIDKSFHPKDEEWFGYLIKINDVLIYHAGDTDKIQEMHKLTGHGNRGINLIALLPIGGRFTMDAEEAAEAAEIIKPSLAIPMHYGSVVGDKSDAEEFVSLCEEKGIKAMILEKE